MCVMMHWHFISPSCSHKVAKSLWTPDEGHLCEGLSPDKVGNTELYRMSLQAVHITVSLYWKKVGQHSGKVVSTVSSQQGSGVGPAGRLGPLCGGFASCACVGFLGVLQFPLIINNRCEWLFVSLKTYK